MQLESLRIYRPYTGYGVKPSHSYNAEIEFANQGSKVTLHLDDEVSRRLLSIVADEVTRAGKQTAENMLATVLEAAGGPVIAHVVTD